MTIEYSNNWSIVTGWGVCGLDKFYGASLPKILQRSGPHAPQSTIAYVLYSTYPCKDLHTVGRACRACRMMDEINWPKPVTTD